MSTVQRVTTVVGNDMPQRHLEEVAARLTRATLGAEARDPVRELVHDLRSPLTSFLALSEALMRGASGEVSDLQRSQLALVYGAALGLTALLTDEHLTSR
jgi:signal transduction histidine kinase